MEIPYDSVLLMAYGAPESMEEVRPFLDSILRGLPVPKERYEAVVHHYELIGGKSPLNELTARQARGLKNWMDESGLQLPVFVGMRFAKPYMFTAINAMVQEGRKRAVGIILAPYRSEPSFEKYQETVQEVLDSTGAGKTLQIDFVQPWFDHPLFAEAQADEVRRALEQVPEARRDQAKLLFTAHSIPMAMADRCPYVAQIETACRNVSNGLDGLPWCLVWQSRSGNPQTPWLEPDVNTKIRELREEGVSDLVLCPIGFISDHVEVMYDLDFEAAQTCRDLGINMIRAGTVNDHPTFIKALGDLVVTKIGADH